MKVLFDLPKLGSTPLGMQTYIENVLREVLLAAPREWTLTLQTNSIMGQSVHNGRMDIIDKGRRAHRRFVKFPHGLYERISDFGGEGLLRGLFKGDLIHSFGCRAIPDSSQTVVLTLQDVIPIRLAEGDKEFIDRSKRTLNRLLKRAKRVITISEFSKSEITAVFGTDPGKITVIPNGVDHSRFKPLTESSAADANHTLKRLSINQPYWLHTGGGAKRKNRLRLIEGFELVKSRYKSEHKLVLVGSLYAEDELAARIAKSPYADQIVNLGYVSEQDALHLLQSACALVFPSTYEGFGLPPLEAMACGVPVAVADSSALPEVAGDAAVYFDPQDAEALGEALIQVTNEPSIRQRCIQRGIERSSRMTWKENAARTISLYEQLAPR